MKIISKETLNNRAVRSRFNTQGLSKLTALSALTILALSGCQSSTPFNQNQSGSSAQLLSAQPELAKSTLIKALEKQRMSSYDYHVNILASNDEQRAALANASAKQLSMSDDPEAHCEHIHDEAYIDLLDRAEEDGLEIDDPKYATTRQALKSAYLECKEYYDEWLGEQPYSDAWFESAIAAAMEGDEYESEYDDDYEDDYDDDDLIAEAQAAAAEAEAAAAEAETVEYSDDYDDYGDYSEYNETDAAIAAAEEDYNYYYENGDDLEYFSEEVDSGKISEFLPNYDASHTKLDAHRANLLNAYLLKPLSITIEGGYRPYTGKIGIMPTLQYQSRNVTLSTTDFVYIDAKQGAVYLWADSFALLLSTYLDEKLGTSMHNKWIKIDLNDGSLPQEFMTDLLKSHLAAQDQMYTTSSPEQYRFISNKDLLSLSPVPDEKHRPYLTNSPSILERKVNETELKQDIQTYLDLLYNQMSNKYPELFEEFEKSAEEYSFKSKFNEYRMEGFGDYSEDDVYEDAYEDEDDYENEYEDEYVYEEEANAEEAMADFDIDDESSIVGVAEDAVVIENDEDDQVLNSRFIMSKLFELIKAAKDSEEEANAEEASGENSEVAVIDEVDEEDDAFANDTLVEDMEMSDTGELAEEDLTDTEVEAREVPTSIDYAKKEDDNNLNKWLWRDVYGLDNQQRITWHLAQRHISDDSRGYSNFDDLKNGLRLETLTRYTGVLPTKPVFRFLPEGASTPNSNNTVNLKDYLDDLHSRYEEGEGTEYSKEFFELMEGLQLQLP